MTVIDLGGAPDHKEELAELRREIEQLRVQVAVQALTIVGLRQSLECEGRLIRQLMRSPWGCA